MEKKIKNHRRYENDCSVNDVAESVERYDGYSSISNGGYGHRTFERYGSSFAQLKLLVKIKAVEAVAKAIRRNRAGLMKEIVQSVASSL